MHAKFLKHTFFPHNVDTALLPVNLMAQQSDYFQVLISWTPPPVLYCDSYSVTLDNDTDFFTYSFSPEPKSQNTTAYIGSVGVHSVHLSVPPYQMDQIVGPVEVTIRGKTHTKLSSQHYSRYFGSLFKVC